MKQYFGKEDEVVLNSKVHFYCLPGIAEKGNNKTVHNTNSKGTCLEPAQKTLALPAYELSQQKKLVMITEVEGWSLVQ